MLTERTTLTQFLIEERRRYPSSSGDLNALVLDVALACKAISKRIAAGALTGVYGTSGGSSDEHETNEPSRPHPQPQPEMIANNIFVAVNEWGGHLAGMVSAELVDPCQIPDRYPRGKYLLAFDPLDGSANLDVALSAGSLFSILRAPVAGRDAEIEDFLQPGTEQVAAGYAIYGPSTQLVITVGTGVHAFTLDPDLGEFFLTRQGIRVPESTNEYAVNSSNRRFWEKAVLRYVDECLAGTAGPREKDFSMRWVDSLVADTHRILTRGGVFLSPRDTKDPAMPGRLRLLYEVNPVALLIEQAGGAATTGRERVLERVPTDVHQRIAFIFGSKDEVERIERYHHEPLDELSSFSHPLYGVRGLFRTSN